MLYFIFYFSLNLYSFKGCMPLGEKGIAIDTRLDKNTFSVLLFGLEKIGELTPTRNSVSQSDFSTCE